MNKKNNEFYTHSDRKIKLIEEKDIKQNTKTILIPKEEKKESIDYTLESGEWWLE